MADLSELLKIIPIDDIAEQLGVSEGQAEAAVQQVLPGLVGGLAVNASSSEGASTLETVLSHHAGKDTSSKAKLKDIDTEDGEKIVGHILGDKEGSVEKLAAASGLGDQAGDLIKKVLPIVAPIVLAWLANQFLGQKSEPKETAQESSSGGGIGDLLGGLLGGGSSSGGAGDVLGGLLGGLLGGKS